MPKEICGVPWCDEVADHFGVCAGHRREELALSELEEELANIQTDADIERIVDANMRDVWKWLRRYEDNEGTMYGRRALANACVAIAGTGKGQRNLVLNYKAYGIGRLVGGGELDYDFAYGALLEVALATRLGHRYCADTIERALKAGMAHPRIVVGR